VLVLVFLVHPINSQIAFSIPTLQDALFFFFGSLSYVPFLHKQGSVRGAIQSILHLREFLPTIFPYRGEAWGTWSQVTFLNQRHFASAIGILLLVLIFLVIRYRAFYAERAAAAPPGKTLTPEADALPQGAPETLSDNATSPESLPASTSAATATPVLEPRQPRFFNAQILRSTVPGFIFSGGLLGLLPMWNSAVFIAAFVILAVLFVFCPLRVQMVALAITAGLIALPQMLYLSTGSGRAQMPKLLHWGYTLDHPTVWNITKYLGFSFGFKWLLIALALLFASSLQRRVFVAVSSLLVVAFSCQFTIEALANQKFFHIWVAIVNLFVAFALWRLWRSSLAGTTLPGKLAAILLFILIIPGGLIEFLPIHNTYWSEVAYKNDPLIEWLMKETKPREIFLTDRFVSHPILMAGRRVFYGWPYYSWGAGYDSTKRDKAYLDLFQTKDPRKVFRLLKDNNISYVAFDNAVRHNEFVKSPNEQVFATYFPKVFQDKEHKYNSLTIYKVPETAPSAFGSLPEVGTSMFEGGRGTGKGEFDSPHGIAADRAGNIYIADTNNHAIRVIDLATKRTSTLRLNGLTPPAVDNQPVTESGSAPNAEEIKTPAQQLRSGTNATLEINVDLPEGYHLNPLAPQRYKISVDGGKSITVDEKLASSNAKDLKLPLRIPLSVVNTGSTNLRAQATLFYCREDNTGTCRIKTLVWQIPIEVIPNGSAPNEVKVHGKLTAD